MTYIIDFKGYRINLSKFFFLPRLDENSMGCERSELGQKSLKRPLTEMRLPALWGKTQVEDKGERVGES